MKISLSKTDTYVPKWRDNRKLPGDQQVTVEYKLMTAEQEERYSEMYLRREGEDDFGMTVKTHAVEIWDECVIKVNGLNDGAKPLTDPKKVRAIPGIYELVTEVVAVIKQGITEEDSKN